MLMFAETNTVNSATNGNLGLRPAFATASLGVLAARHDNGLTAVYVDGHTAYHGTGVTGPAPHDAISNPYQSVPFSDFAATWKGE